MMLRATRCPKPNASPEEAEVHIWHNFTGELAEIRQEYFSEVAPRARVELRHDCGWKYSFGAEVINWSQLSEVISGHFGTCACGSFDEED